MGTSLRLPLFWTTLTDVRSTGQIFSTTHSIWVLLDVAVTMRLGLWVSEKKTTEVRHPCHDTKSGCPQHLWARECLPIFPLELPSSPFHMLFRKQFIKSSHTRRLSDESCPLYACKLISNFFYPTQNTFIVSPTQILHKGLKATLYLGHL